MGGKRRSNGMVQKARSRRPDTAVAAHSRHDAAPVPRGVADLQRIPRDVVAHARDFADGHVIARDRHPRGQLVYGVTGVMTVTTPHGTWVVPPQRAVWVPPDVDHESRMYGAVAMRTVYVERSAASAMPDRCCVVTVSPLLRELILEATRVRRDYDERGRDGRVMRLVLDELAASPAMPLHLPQPQDRRLRRICAALLEHPGRTDSLEDWAARVGSSARTLARTFARETGMGFATWRQQARLAAALQRLAAGAPVTAVALDLGYASPSAFTAMFRRALGTRPSDYFRDYLR
jgi:AraC-like DNA-binding protein